MKCDLHIHSVLSPCGSLEMSPSNIVEKARQIGLDLIALTDHNSARNCRALKQYIENNDLADIKALYGIEAQSSEEVHAICLFEKLEDAENFGDYLKENLPRIENDEELFGMQLVVDDKEEIIDRENILLSNSLKINLKLLVDKVEEYGGLVIPSHVFRESFGLIEQLGFIPDSVKKHCPGVEVSYSNWTKDFPKYKTEDSSFLCFSDAHTLDEIGACYTNFKIREASIEELKLAIENRKGRGIESVFLQDKGK